MGSERAQRCFVSGLGFGWHDALLHSAMVLWLYGWYFGCTDRLAMIKIMVYSCRIDLEFCDRFEDSCNGKAMLEICCDCKAIG